MHRMAASSLGLLIGSADLIVGAKVGTPAAVAFGIVLMRGIIKPDSKAVFPRLLCYMVVDTIVDRDLSLRGLS